MEYTLDRVGTPIFTLDADGNVVHWNTRIEELTGVNAEDARSMDMASQAFYPDGRRAKTLADKVLAGPESVDEEFGVGQADDVAFTMYEDESTMVDRNGVERHISCRTQETEELVAELETTIDALRAGDHDARAAYEGAGHLDESLLGVMDGLNALAGQLEALSTHVVGQVEELETSSETVADTARDINGLAGEQSETMGTISGEVANLSATVEEIASTADEVADATDDQAASAEEVASMVDEASEMADDVAVQIENIAGETDQQQRRVQEVRQALEENTV